MGDCFDENTIKNFKMEECIGNNQEKIVILGNVNNERAIFSFHHNPINENNLKALHLFRIVYYKRFNL